MASGIWRLASTALVASIALAGCGPESQDVPPATPAPVQVLPNSVPTISGMPALAATAGVLWQFQPLATDADGDVLSYSATGLPGWANLDLQTGAVSGTPSAADAGTTAAIVIRVSDGEAAAMLAPFSITVTVPAPVPTPEPAPVPTPAPPSPTPLPPPANTAPVITGTPSATVQATRPYFFTPAASDADSGQTLTFSITNRPAWAAFSSTTGQLSGTPPADQAGTYGNIRIGVTDGTATALLPAFSITVTAPPNRAPTIAGTPSTTVTVGNAYSFRPTASDPDGQRLTYSITNRPAWASFSTSTGQLSGTPTAAHVGTTSNIVIRVSDGTASASLAAFSIIVAAAPNRAPTISGAPVTTATVDVAWTFLPTGADADGDALTWSVTGRPTGSSFSTSTGQLSFTPTAAGTWSNIVVTVTDANGASASLPAFTLTVPAPPAPATGSAELSWRAPTQYTDGSTLPSAQISAYRIYHGSSAGDLDRVAEVDGNTSLFTLTDLTAGTHYFAVTTVSAAGIESTFSGVGSKTIQ